MKNIAAGAYSLRTRLLLFLFLAVALFALAQGISAYHSALRQADDLFDLHLQQMANAMRGRHAPTLSTAPSLGVDVDVDGDAQPDVLVQIWGADGATVFKSPNAAPAALPQTAILGFSDVRVEGRNYRVYAVQTPLQTIQIAQDMSARSARASTLAWQAALPTMLLAPLLMLAVWAVVSQSLASLERTRRQIAARKVDDLSPLDDQGLPREVQPLVQELNVLFGRVHHAFAVQKSFVADAAHELRSPLAALKLQAQAVSRTAGTDTALLRLNQGIDRTIQLVEQLLALARAEVGTDKSKAGAKQGEKEGASEYLPEHQPVDLRTVICLAVADALPQAQAAGFDLGFQPSEDGISDAPALVQGDAEALRTLLRNLLDNALKYTPSSPNAPGRVDVALHVAAGQLDLTVDDSGPGIAGVERERVFDRFYRADSTRQSQPGNGLGLAIVRAIAERHGATVALLTSPTLHGLRVQVRFLR